MKSILENILKLDNDSDSPDVYWDEDNYSNHIKISKFRDDMEQRLAQEMITTLAITLCPGFYRN